MYWLNLLMIWWCYDTSIEKSIFLILLGLKAAPRPSLLNPIQTEVE